MLLLPSVHSPPSMVLMKNGIRLRDGVNDCILRKDSDSDCILYLKSVTVFGHWSVRWVSAGREWSEETLCEVEEFDQHLAAREGRE